jgi:hypothetical protein
MIVLFGGFQFRHVKLWRAEGIQLLLNACAETLETLWFDPWDLWHCKKVSLKTARPVLNQNFSVGSFDLSQNKSLRELKVTKCDISDVVQYPPLDLTSTLKRVLSTITSPVFCKFTICYPTTDFPGIFFYDPFAPPMFLSYMPLNYWRDRCVSNHQVFDLMRELQKARDFRLVLCADVWGALTKYAMRELEWIIQVGWVEAEPDSTSSQPLVTCSPREFLPAPSEITCGVTNPSWAHPWAPRPNSTFSVFPRTTV